MQCWAAQLSRASASRYVITRTTTAIIIINLFNFHVKYMKFFCSKLKRNNTFYAIYFQFIHSQVHAFVLFRYYTYSDAQPSIFMYRTNDCAFNAPRVCIETREVYYPYFDLHQKHMAWHTLTCSFFLLIASQPHLIPHNQQ